MKWKKFLELKAQHPQIGNDLTWRGGRHDTKEFVRTKVGFIAFRRFESLDLSAKCSSNSTSLKSDYVHVTMDSYVAVEYQISFHVDGEGLAARSRLVYDSVGDGSIQAHIDEITAWFESYEAFRGKQLVWEHVVKRSVSGSSYAGLTNINLEIYPFPRFYRFKPMPRVRYVPADPATIAYVRRTEMPPIVPGPQFA